MTNSSQFFRDSQFTPSLFLEMPEFPRTQWPVNKYALLGLQKSILLPPAFLDTVFCLLSMLAVSQHGELHLKSSGNQSHRSAELLLEFGNSYRYFYKGDALLSLQEIYTALEILEFHTKYRFCRRKML